MNWVRSITCLSLVLVLVPCEANANALLPSLNSYRGTSAFWFSFLVIVVIESLCALPWLKTLRVQSVWWRIVLCNAASSLAGYALMYSEFGPRHVEVWRQAIPFFCLTLVVELPLIRILFGRDSGWTRSLFLCATLNLLSYTALIALERPLEQVWMDGLRARDKRILAAWKDTQMLSETQGCIYGTESRTGTGQHRLRVFNLGDMQWRSLSNCPSIYPFSWDIEGELFAFIPEVSSGTVKVVTLPDFDPVCDLELPVRGSPGTYIEITISPDQCKLAVLVPGSDRGVSVWSLRWNQTAGSRIGVLSVFDLTTGEVLGTCPRKALGGICWLPDSQSVLFDSIYPDELQDPEAYQAVQRVWKPAENQNAINRPTAYDFATNALLHSETSQSVKRSSVFAYDIYSGTVRHVANDMASVHLAANGTKLLCRAGRDEVRILDLQPQVRSHIKVGTQGVPDLKLSPDGDFALLSLTLDSPVSYFGHPVIVDLRNTNRRHFLGEQDYRFDWTTTPNHDAR